MTKSYYCGKCDKQCSPDVIEYVDFELSEYWGRDSGQEVSYVELRSDCCDSIVYRDKGLTDEADVFDILG